VASANLVASGDPSGMLGIARAVEGRPVDDVHASTRLFVDLVLAVTTQAATAADAAVVASGVLLDRFTNDSDPADLAEFDSPPMERSKAADLARRAQTLIDTRLAAKARALGQADAFVASLARRGLV
jgi:hypothetical protein